MCSLWARASRVCSPPRAARRAGAAGRPLRLTVWERATYPSGRFGATAAHGAAVADLGSQVLSTVDPRDERAQPGHGISTGARARRGRCAATSWREDCSRPRPTRRSARSRSASTGRGSGTTRTRRAAWARCFERCSGREARRVRFGLRVDGVAATHAGGTAWGVQRHGDGASTPLRELRLGHSGRARARRGAVANVAASLPPASAAILHGVGYDRRVATAIFYENGDGLIGSRLAALCGARGATGSILTMPTRRATAFT